MDNLCTLTKQSSFIDTDWRHEPSKLNLVSPPKKTYQRYQSKMIKEMELLKELEHQLIEEYDKVNGNASTSVDKR